MNRGPAATSAPLGAIRKVVGEGILLVGGTRAILLQVAHPAIARAVAEHSDFTVRPLERFRATLVYVYGTVFGTPEEAAFVSETVDAAHGRVAGTGYDAHDPELQLWVAATLYDTAVTLYDRIFGRPGEAFAADLYRQYAVLGTALQVPAGAWPPDRNAFASYWAKGLTRLEVTAEARSIAAKLLSPGSLTLRPLAPANRLVSVGLLPAPVREQYGLRWDGPRQRMFDLVLGSLSLCYPLLPHQLRALPAAYCLHDLRRRIRSGRNPGGRSGQFRCDRSGSG